MTLPEETFKSVRKSPQDRSERGPFASEKAALRGTLLEQTEQHVACRAFHADEGAYGHGPGGAHADITYIVQAVDAVAALRVGLDRKSTRLNSSHRL